MKTFLLSTAGSFGLLAALASAAHAQAVPPATPAAPAPGTSSGAVPAPGAAAASAPTAETPSPPPPGYDWGPVHFVAQVEGGVAFNTAGSKTNFGSLFTDHPNQAQLNQVLLTAQKALDPKATGWDVGFKLQALYGSDARYTHFVGELDRTIGERYQLDIVEANVSVHIPYLTEGGTDLKLGQYSTPIGFETIDPSTNAFYSHSYIFNFGIPLKHTGGLAIVHATPVIDAYFGIDSGVNTSLGGNSGDNNSAPGYIVGFGLNTLLGGNLTVVALTHIGPENPSRSVVNANHYLRYLNDAYATYKWSDKFTTTTEVNYIRDDLARADAWGIAQYGQYTLTDTLTLNGRAELFRDNRGFFVGAFPGNLDFINAEEGRPATILGAPKTTYGAITLGMTYKPSLPPIPSLMIRPEIRYDHSLNDTRPFNSGKDKGSLTISSDFVLAF